MTMMSKILILIFCVVSLESWGKTHPFDAQTEAQLADLFLEKNSIASLAKVTAYEARMNQKVFEISNLVAANERRTGETDQEKIDEKVSENDMVIALKRCQYLLKTMKTSSSREDILRNGYEVLTLEGAVRIEGAGNSFAVIINQLRNYLGSWTIPYSSPAIHEAANLYDNKNKSFLGPEQMANVDISTFDPEDTSPFWRNPGDISKVDIARASLGLTTPFYSGVSILFPVENRFKFDEMKHSDTKPKMDVYYKDKTTGKKVKFKIKVGAEIHADPTVAALTMTLGYGADVTKFVRDVRIDLGKKYTLSDLKRDWEVFYSRDNARTPYKIENYIKESGEDENGHYVIFKEALLEAKPSEIGRLGGWSFKEFGHLSRREVRGMTLIQMWMDNTDLKEFENNKILVKGDDSFHIISDLGKALGGVFGEKPELFHSKVVSARGNQGLIMNYRAFMPVAIKNQMTFADARWGARLIGSLSRKQIETAVRIGQWPECVAKIYVEKLISRRNDLLTNLNLIGSPDRSGQTLSLMPLQLTEEQMIFDRACTPEEVKPYTTDFDFSARFLMKPILKSAMNKLIDISTGLLGSMRTITITGPDADFDKAFISQIILNLRREIEKNPDPKNEKDLFIVRDHFEVGLRLGVNFGIFKDMVYTRSFSLAYPVRSKEEARLNNGFIVNVLLPRDVATGNLPKKYVLHTDHFFQHGIGIEADDITKPVGIGFRARASRARIMRSILDHRDEDRIVVYRDRTDYAETFLQAFVRAGIIKFPFLTTYAQWGNATGAGAIITKAELEGDKDLNNNLFNAVVNGDFTVLKDQEEDFRLRNRFENRQLDWNFIFWKGRNSARLERISIEREEGEVDVLQYRTDHTRGWNFFGRGEKKSVAAEVFASPDEKDFQLKLLVDILDKSTKDNELENAYLYFINGLSATGDKIIPFTPSLGYSTNGKWGALITHSETTYYPEAINAILSITPDDFWRSLGLTYGVSFTSDYSSYLQAKKDLRFGDQSRRYSILRSYDLSEQTFKLFEKAEDFLHDLKPMQREMTSSRKIKRLGKLFRKLAYSHEAGFFEPRLLGALNRFVGPENFFCTNLITPPPFAELNMIDEKPLFGEMGKARPDQSNYIHYIPESAVALYTVFNNWGVLK